MKVIGIMLAKDEADILPEVFPHVAERVDHLFVYDDGSQDDTWDIVKNADYAIRREDDHARPNIKRPMHHHLLEKIKSEFDCNKEDVWAVITEADRFFLNKPPRKIIAEAGNHRTVCGIQLDFLRHQMDPWTEENDTFPVYHPSLRKICRWFRLDERFVIAFKVKEEISYLTAKYPWPRGMEEIPQYSKKYFKGEEALTMDVPFLEHQGRKSPRSFLWRYQNGSRKISKKYKNRPLSTFDEVRTSMSQFYNNYRVYPWINIKSLEKFLKLYNDENFRNNKEWFFRGMSHLAPYVPPREDV